MDGFSNGGGNNKQLNVCSSSQLTALIDFTEIAFYATL